MSAELSTEFPSVLRSLQEAVVARLASSPRLAGVEVFSRLKADVDSEIEAKLGEIGVAIFVSPPLPKASSPDVSGPWFDSTDITIRILEQPVANSTGKDAYFLWETCARRLHHWTPPDIPGAGAITIDPDPLDDSSTKKRRIFDLLVHCPCGFQPED